MDCCQTLYVLHFSFYNNWPLGWQSLACSTAVWRIWRLRFKLELMFDQCSTENNHRENISTLIGPRPKLWERRTSLISMYFVLSRDAGEVYICLYLKFIFVHGTCYEGPISLLQTISVTVLMTSGTFVGRDSKLIEHQWLQAPHVTSAKVKFT